MTWVLAIGAAWLALAGVVAVLIGRGIRMADRKESVGASTEGDTPNFVVDLDPAIAPTESRAIAPRPRVSADEAPSTREHGLA